MSRRRRIGFILAALMLIAVTALGIQAWRVVEAVRQAEQSAVHPLSESTVEIGGALQSSPVPTSQAVARADDEVTPTSTPELVVSTTPAAAGNATTSSTPTIVPTGTSVPTVRPTVTPKDDGPSRLEILRKVVAAGMEDGDPGRSTVWEGKTDLNILVLGVDRRAEGGDQNADVIIIAHLDLLQGKLAAVSIPRDLLVDIPGVGPDKINGSYNFGVIADPDDPAGGANRVRDTVEYVFGIPIDGYTLLDFDGFRDVVDAAGGIEIDVPAPIHDTEYPTEDFGTKTVDFAAGPQEMDGERALEYVRTRHGDSDDGRRDRQRQVLMALFAKGKQFSSATRADNIILALGDSIQTSFPLEQQLTLARLAYAMDEANITISSLGQPILSAGTTPDGRWAYVGNLNEIVTFVQNAIAIPDQDESGP